MKRRVWASVLCCLLAALLPLAALAENPALSLLNTAYTEGKTIEATFHVTPGDGLLNRNQSMEAMLGDLLNALTVRAAVRNDGLGSLTLTIHELDDNGVPTGESTDALTAALRFGEDGLYLRTEALGDKPVYLTATDIAQAANGVLQSFGQSGSLTGALTGKTDVPPTDEELRAKLVQSFGGDAALADAMLAIKARATTTEVAIQADDHDPAVTKREVTLTQDDLLAVVSSDFCRAQLVKSYQKKADPEREADEDIAEAKASLAKSQINIPITVLLDAEGRPVCVDCLVTGHIADDDDNEYTDITVPFRYTRKTGDTGVRHACSFVATKREDGRDEPEAYLTGEAFHGADGSLTATLTAGEYDDGREEPELAVNLDYRWNGNTADGLLSVVGYDDKKNEELLVKLTQAVGDASLTNTLALYTQRNVAEPMRLAADAKPTLSCMLDFAITDGKADMDALAAATPETSVRVAQLSSDELQSYLSTIQGNALRVLAQLVSKLPASLGTGLGNLLMGGFGK